MDPSKCAKYILWTLSTFCKHYLNYVINNEYATDNIYTTSSDSTMIAKKKNVYVVCLCTVFGRTVCFCFDTSLASSNHLLCIAELNYFFGQTAEPLYYSP